MKEIIIDFVSIFFGCFTSSLMMCWFKNKEIEELKQLHEEDIFKAKKEAIDEFSKQLIKEVKGGEE